MSTNATTCYRCRGVFLCTELTPSNVAPTYAGECDIIKQQWVLAFWCAKCLKKHPQLKETQV